MRHNLRHNLRHKSRHILPLLEIEKKSVSKSFFGFQKKKK